MASLFGVERHPGAGLGIGRVCASAFCWTSSGMTDRICVFKDVPCHAVRAKLDHVDASVAGYFGLTLTLFNC